VKNLIFGGPSKAIPASCNGAGMTTLLVVPVMRFGNQFKTFRNIAGDKLKLSQLT
jgi:hypothetical protein